MSDIVEASLAGDLKKVRSLVRAGIAEGNSLAELFEEQNEENNWNALSAAVFSGHLHVVQYLVKQGADKDDVDENGSTPLHHAALEGHLSIVQYLVEQGANTDAVNNDNETPLDSVKNMSGYEKIEEFLAAHKKRAALTQQNVVEEREKDREQMRHLFEEYVSPLHALLPSHKNEESVKRKHPEDEMHTRRAEWQLQATQLDTQRGLLERMNHVMQSQQVLIADLQARLASVEQQLREKRAVQGTVGAGEGEGDEAEGDGGKRRKTNE